jgi:hypothetical protein
MRFLVAAALLAGCSSAPVCQEADVEGSWVGNPVQGTFDSVTMVLDAGGAYSIYLNSQPFVGGHWAWDASASQLTILDDPTCAGAGPAVYGFAVEDGSSCRSAILHYVSDPCTDRITTLNGMHITKL